MNKHFLKFCLFSFAVNNCLALSFSDLSSYNENYKSVSNLYEKGIIKGFDDGTFKPEKSVSRAEALKMLSLGLNLKIRTENFNEKNFTDVTKDDWFKEYVDIATSNELVKGFDDGTFKPNSPITFAEILKISLKAKNKNTENVENTLSLDQNLWYINFANFAYSNNYFDLKGRSLDFLNKEISRAETAELIYRISKSEGKYNELDDFKEIIVESGYKFYVPDYFKVRVFNSGLIATGFSQDLDVLDKPDFIIESETIKYKKMDPLERIKILKEENQLSETFIEQKDEFTLLKGNYLNTNIIKYFYVSDTENLEVSFAYKSGARNDEFKEIEKVITENIQKLTVDADTLRDKTLELARESILKSYKGMQIIKQFNDIELFHTDTIGLGSGPVDYYYDKDTNHTFKYERSFDVIMDIKEGKSKDF